MESTTEQLRAQLADLQTANDALRRELAQERSGTRPERPARAARTAWGWAVLSAVLITVGAVVAPVAVVSAWANHDLTDTAYFVDTFAPLADDPAVQDFVAAEAVTAIESALDIEALADDLFSGLAGLDIDPRAKAALGLLQAPAVAGVEGMIQRTVTEFVRSDAFSQVWRQALTAAHTQLVNTATGQADAVITIGENQEVSLQLGPIIESVKQRLLDNGFALADRIPTISRTIVIAESSSAASYVALYQVVVAVGVWLPWVGLLLLAAGVLVARRRSLALLWASGALLLSMVLVGGGIGVGENLFAVEVASAIPHDAAVALYAGILGFVSSMVVVVGVLAATVFVVTLFAGPWQWARTVRGLGASGLAAIRNRAEAHGITTGRTGEWLYRWRMPLRIAVAALCAAFIVFTRPLTPGMIVWTAVIGVCVIGVMSVASRPIAADPVRETERQKEIA
ncbi:hypothetical protein LQ938_02810 [Microbacterium sp. cx-55]|uniref:hypothetical protein n=1 Tax=Microbacterium sp. cx-55 TaxID=2875948 RepID=UPI001CBA9F6A|nr:hypothetical protein [Microbacterium sp. cx-55]MBZ4486820.1 hypothetical protein [Microbacterium sp. cx-55]UGB35750.1 hypothetical protein LQ938_02810 [Microbacterium sp. cx-55]